MIVVLFLACSPTPWRNLPAEPGPAPDLPVAAEPAPLPGPDPGAVLVADICARYVMETYAERPVVVNAPPLAESAAAPPPTSSGGVASAGGGPPDCTRFSGATLGQ